MAPTETAGNGHYWRDHAGVWRYTISGDPVPGARPRQLFDAHDYPRVQIDGIRYVDVPHWRLDSHPELISVCARDGVLVSEADYGAKRMLVPEYLWPDAPDPAGGMWAPELAPDQLMDARELAAFCGLKSPDVVKVRLYGGTLPVPVVRIGTGKGRPAGLPTNAPTMWWTRPVLEQWLARYRVACPLRYDAPKRRATLARNAAERARVLTELGRKPKPRRKRSA